MRIHKFWLPYALLMFGIQLSSGCHGSGNPIYPYNDFATRSVQLSVVVAGLPEYHYDADVAVDPLSGEIFCCWVKKINGTSEIVWRHGMPGSLGPEEIITPFDGYRSFMPSITAGPDGTIHLAWMDQMIDGKQKEIYWKAWRNGSWGPFSILSLEDGWTGWDPDVETYPDGRPLVAWFDHRFGVQHEILMRIGDGYGFWWPDVRWTNDRHWQTYPDIEVDPEGTVHLVYTDMRHIPDEWGGGPHYAPGKNTEIYYRTWDGNLSVETRVSNTPHRSLASHMAVDSAGRAHIIWLDDSETDWWVLRYAMVEDGVVGPMQAVSDINHRADIAAIESVGDRVFIVYPEYPDTEGSSLADCMLYVREVLPGRGLGTPLLIADHGTNGYPRAAADVKRGGLWVVWTEYLGDDEEFMEGPSRLHLAGIKID
jgi:hypothetical protein